MSDGKPTNGELAIMIKALKEHGDEKHRVVSDYMKDIRDTGRDTVVHVDNLKTEVVNLGLELRNFERDFADHKKSTASDNKKRDERIEKAEARISFFDKWYWKIMGGIAVLGTAVSVGLAIVGLSNKGVTQEEFQEALAIYEVPG